MAWIESHSELRHHPKLTRLVITLKVDRVAAIGHLHCLWWWAMQYAEDGNLSPFSAAEVAAAAEWEGDADCFRAALRSTGWLDDDGSLHDWWEYAGKLVVRREKNREAMRLSRGARPKNTCTPRVDHVDNTCRPTYQPTNLPTYRPTIQGVGQDEELKDDGFDARVAQWIGDNQIALRVMPCPSVYQDFRKLVSAIGWDDGCKLVMECAKDRKIVHPVKVAITRAAERQGRELSNRDASVIMQNKAGVFNA